MNSLFSTSVRILERTNWITGQGASATEEEVYCHLLFARNLIWEKSPIFQQKETTVVVQFFSLIYKTRNLISLNF